MSKTNKYIIGMPRQLQTKQPSRSQSHPPPSIKAHLFPQLEPLLHKGRASHVLRVRITSPRLLTHRKMHVFNRRDASVLAFGVVEHVVVDAAVHFLGPGGVGELVEVVGEQSCGREREEGRELGRMGGRNAS